MEKIGLDLDQRMVISEAGLRENFRKYVERIALSAIFRFLHLAEMCGWDHQ